MIRVTLFAYMLLLSLTGPSPCCCTLAQFVSSATAYLRDVDEVSFPSGGCCHQCVPERDSSGPHESSNNERRGSDCAGDDCHCPKSVLNGVTFLFDANSVALRNSDDNVFLDSANWAGHVRLIQRADSLRVSPPESAMPSGRQMRVVLHSWRC
jgi:hypothetical protein